MSIRDWFKKKEVFCIECIYYIRACPGGDFLDRCRKNTPILKNSVQFFYDWNNAPSCFDYNCTNDCKEFRKR